MTERFRHAELAANYLASGLEEDFPDATIEVLFLSRENSRLAKCPVKEAGRVLRGFLRYFPKASVDYFPDNRYGVVAEVRCHGDLQVDADEAAENPELLRLKPDRHHHGERPMIVVVVNRPRTGADQRVPSGSLA